MDDLGHAAGVHSPPSTMSTTVFIEFTNPENAKIDISASLGVAETYRHVCHEYPGAQPQILRTYGEFFAIYHFK